MPELTRSTTQLTLGGARVVLDAAIGRAEEMQVPQCIAVVDAGGHLLAFARMDGAKVLSELSAMAKAKTAASSRVESGGIPDGVDVRLGMATGGQVTNLKGGLPIVVDGEHVGAVGVGSGTGDEDVMVGQAGVDALLAERAG